jgi:heme oxygenase
LSSENPLAELRLTTRAEHDRIEHLLRLTEPMPLQRYAAIVVCFDAFLRAWEPRIQAALPERLRAWFRPRRRGGFASADVEWLRTVAGLALPAPTAHAATVLPLTDLAEVMGSLYVIEDAALEGHRVIAPQLKRSLGLDQGCGASYFHGFGGEAAAMWSNFSVLAALEVGESARGTFAALIELFAPLAPAPAPAVAPAPVVQRIAPALLTAYGPEDDAATRPSPLADIHIDLPSEDGATDGDTLVELPMDEEDADALGGDTIRMPL